MGGYEPDYTRLNLLGYAVIPRSSRAIVTVMNADQGIGLVKGTVRLESSPVAGMEVCLLRRDTKKLLWTTKTKVDGSFAFSNVKRGLECIVIALDLNRIKNAKIKDQIVAK